MITRDPDYKGPIWDSERADRIAYLALDNTRLPARTERLQAHFATVLVDYDEFDMAIGIEVIW